jgi:hypothetical protein
VIPDRTTNARPVEDHGVEQRQVDVAASVIRLLEPAGLVSGVHWRAPERVTALRR